MIYREAHVLLEEIAEAALDGTRKELMEALATVPLLIIDDLGMRKLGPTAAEELLEIVMRRYQRQHLGDFQPARRGLWKTARRHRGRHRHAGPPPAPWSHPQMWTAELEDQVADRPLGAGKAMTKNHRRPRENAAADF